MINLDHQMRSAMAVARPRQKTGQRERAERHRLGVESAAGKQLEMAAQIILAREGGDNQRVRALASNPGKGNSRIVDREGQMFFERERNHLLETAVVAKWQCQQALGDKFTRQRRDHGIWLACRLQHARDGAAQVRLVSGPRLFVCADEFE